MGAISGMLGTAGGINGTGIKGPKTTNLQSPVTPEQVAAGQAGTNAALGGSNALISALQGTQNGVVNQDQTYGQGQDIYNQIAANNGLGTQAAATGAQAGLNKGVASLGGAGVMGNAMGQQGGLNTQLGNAGGIQAQMGGIQGLQNVLAAQQGTAGQLQGIANGTGPNPAQAALNQATGQNIANQAALMAGQRGAGSNVGLMARQAAQQGAGIQQQAVGQGATMQAQQEMNALGQLTAQQQAMGATNQGIAGIGAGLTGAQQAGINNLYGQGQGAVNALQTGIGQQFGQGATTTGQLMAQQGANTANAQNEVGNLIGATGTNMQGNLTNSGQLIGAAGQQNATKAGMQGNVNSANAGLAGNVMGGQQAMIGGLLSGGAAGSKTATGGVPAAAAAAEGGLVQKMAAGGPTDISQPLTFGSYLQKVGNSMTSSGDALGGDTPGQKAIKKGAADMSGAFVSALKGPAAAPAAPLAGPDASAANPGIAMAAKGGRIKAMVSENEVVLPPDVVKSSDAPERSADFVGRVMKNKMPYDQNKEGGLIMAKDSKQKAEKSGNSYDNDKIPEDLPEGSVVIPRSVMQAKDPIKASADFVSKIIAKRGKK